MKNKGENSFEVILVLVLGLSFIFAYSGNSGWLYAAWIIGIPSLFSSHFRKVIGFFWMRLSGLLNKIMPSVVLAMVYYILLFPMAIAFRLLSKKDVLRKEKPLETNFIPVNKVQTKSDLEFPW